MERKAAAVPGSLFFIRLVYHDGTDRPHRFEAGVQDGEVLLVDLFENTSAPRKPLLMVALRNSVPFPLDTAFVEGCLGPAASDAVFARGWRRGPASLARAERCAVAEVPLDSFEWHVLWHFTGPGRTGWTLSSPACPHVHSPSSSAGHTV